MSRLHPLLIMFRWVSEHLSVQKTPLETHWFFLTFWFKLPLDNTGVCIPRRATSRWISISWLTNSFFSRYWDTFFTFSPLNGNLRSSVSVFNKIQTNTCSRIKSWSEFKHMFQNEWQSLIDPLHRWLMEIWFEFIVKSIEGVAMSDNVFPYA